MTALTQIPLSGILLGSVACYLFSRVVYELFLSPYKNIPGPFLAKFTRLWWVRQITKQHSDETLGLLHEQNGPVLRIGPNLFSFDNPADAAIIYGLNSGFNKSTFYHGIADPKRASLFSTQDEKFHAERKRQVAGMYSMSTMINYEPAVDDMINVALRRLGDIAAQGSLLSVDRFLQYFALDVIARLTYDRDFGMMERMADYRGILGLIEKLLSIGPIMGTIPELVPWVMGLARMVSKKPPGVELTSWSQDAIAEARKQHTQPKANAKAEPFITKCLNLEAAGKLDHEGIMNSCSANINAGSDTIGSTLTAIIYFLNIHPESLARLREEIDCARKKGDISMPVSFQECQKSLPYLGAVIKEGLRMNPAVGHILPRVVPKGGAKLAGHHFPAGAEVACCARVLHLNQRYHGNDCLNWRPERWLESDALEKDAIRRIGSQFSFGGGSRVCIGQNVALLEMTKFLPEVVTRFDFEFETSPLTGECAEPRITTTFFRWMRYNCFVRERSM